MSHFAALAPIPPGPTTPTLHPTVFVDHHPEPRLSVQELRARLPLGLITCRLRVHEPAIAQDLVGRTVWVAVARPLIDASHRWEVLTAGRLVDPAEASAEGRSSNLLEVQEAWEDLLQASPRLVLRTDTEGEPRQVTGGRLQVGGLANRSPQLHAVAGTAVHVLHPGGASWTVGQALTSISVFYGLGLDLRTLPPQLGDQRLSRSLYLGPAIDAALEKLLEEQQLTIARRWTWQGREPIETRRVIPLEHGRRVRLPAEPRGVVTRWQRVEPTRRAQRWVVRGQRPIVESTFALLPGWDPDLEDQPDTAYDAAQSADFSRYANVFRRWVLNEDGGLADRPRFDLDALFGQAGLAREPVAFGDNLTRDDAGQRLAPVVQLSIDAGQTWTRWAEGYALLTDRAGMRLDAPQLPQGVLDAARAHDLRVRVTATLTSPQPRTARRWRGNPFADVGPEVVLEMAERFRFQKIAVGSLHHDAVAGGRLRATQYDDTQAMDRYLVDRLAREARLDLSRGGRVEAELAGARPELRVGDWVEDLERLEPRPPGRSVSVPRRAGVVTELRCLFGERPSTRLVLGS